MKMEKTPAGPEDWFKPHSKVEFNFCGKSCVVIVPNTVASGGPWIWRTKFIGAFPSVDIDLLSKGFHVVFIDTPDMLFGDEATMKIWDEFYDLVRREFKLAEKVTLEGFSRGGLYAYAWAARNPQKVNCIYADAPVCDVCSWPGGKGKGPGDPTIWQQYLDAYGLTDETAASFPKNPINTLAPIAAAKIPVLHVAGDVDDLVLIDENTYVLAERYRALGGDIKLIIKPGVNHHPHSLENPAEIVKFITENS